MMRTMLALVAASLAAREISGTRQPQDAFVFRGQRRASTRTLAFAAGGFGGGSSRSTSKAKRKKRKGRMSDVAPVVKAATDAPVLDKWGLPPPTTEDIFPLMPAGTELIAVTKEEHSLQEVRDALKDHIPLDLSNFDDAGVEKNVPASDRLAMRLRLLHQSPPVLAIDNYFTPQECLQVQGVAVPPVPSNDAVFESVQIESATFSPLAQSKRTSTSWFAHYAQVPVLLAKTRHMLGIPIEQMEEPQIVRYKTGQEFSWHYDEVPRPQLENGGQRLATLLVYLNSVQGGGGGTIFRDLQDSTGNPLSMQPVQGSALLFFPAFCDGRPDDRTLHKGEVVARDVKWIIQMWTHERSYQAAVPLGNFQKTALPIVEQVSRDLGYV